MTGACVPNIGRRGQRRRLRGGLLAFAAALGFAVVVADAALPIRALVFLPLLAAGYGIFQHREKT